MAAGLAVAAGGCSIADRIVGPPEPSPVDESPRKARERVEAYLAAMVAKDTAAGRAQLCPTLAGTFDKTATGDGGDFHPKITVSQASVTDVRADGDGHKVTAAMAVTSGKTTTPVGVTFFVANVGDGWCIAGEEPAVVLPSLPSPPSPTASP